MPSRAIWAGQIKTGATAVPVKLYSAAQDKSVHFHILEAKTKTRVKQHMVNPETGEEVAPQDIRKAYEVERGTFVLLDDEELSKLAPKPSRDIEITRLPNGVRVITEAMPHVRSVSVGIWIGTGSRFLMAR